MREWLTVIIALLILGILVDGLRRMRLHRRQSLRLSHRAVEADGASDDDLDFVGSEFPKGGARIAAHRDPEEIPGINQNLRDSYVASRQTRGAPKRMPDQVSVNLESTVPMLMEVDDRSDNGSDFDQDYRDQMNQQGYAEERVSVQEPQIGTLDDLDDELGLRSAARTTTSEAFEPDRQDLESEQPKNVEQELEAPLSDHSASSNDEPAESAVTTLPDEVLIINVMARRGQRFDGAALSQALIDQDLRFGEMDIFHRHEEPDGRGRIVFSVANIVMPGTFDLATMEQFDTPGISMFLSLPIRGDSLEAFDSMVAVAQALAALLDGELKDQDRSVMTRQTIEHERQRVIEYERKCRLAKA